LSTSFIVFQFIKQQFEKLIFIYLKASANCETQRMLQTDLDMKIHGDAFLLSHLAALALDIQMFPAAFLQLANVA
jgi:acyl CoA:acetate/3-ketoacid CoA transferase alpha subunit